jgi:hypothetical protein
MEVNTADKPLTTSDDAPAPEQQTQQCKNCHTPLTGPFCHQCGQPDKSIIRFFGDLVRELLEDIISLDSRAARTLVALLFRPGYLTREYIAGRRFYYVPPLRLFLITSLFCIFVIWLINKTSDQQTIQFNDTPVTTQEQITAKRDKILQKLTHKPLGELSEPERITVRQKFDAINQALELAGDPKLPVPDELLSVTERQALSDHAEKASRSEQSDTIPERPTASPPKTGPLSTEPKDKDIGLEIKDDGKVTVNLPFLSAEDNQQLQQKLTDNVKKLKDPNERQDFLSDLLELIPKTMLLFVPLFALFMKLSYPFARRYYIEHLIHAFHGHAFLFLAITLSIGLELIANSLTPAKGWLSVVGQTAGFLEAMLMFWIPIYFLMSLRRVYQQHWALTVIKWIWLGLIYLLLFSISAAVLLLLSVLYN